MHRRAVRRSAPTRWPAHRRTPPQPETVSSASFDMLAPHGLFLPPPRVLASLWRADAQSTRAASSLPLWGAIAGSLRSRRGPALVARVPDRPRAEHVALPRADANLCRRGAGHAW